MHEIKYPVLIYKLELHDPGYDKGYRYMIEQPDHDQHFFKTLKGVHGARRFAQLHGMRAITFEEMDALRQVHEEE